MQIPHLLQRFVVSEAGFILSSEALLLGTIGTVGMVVGLSEVRNSVVQELGDFSLAVALLSQDYAYTSVTTDNVLGSIETSGSVYEDDEDDQSSLIDANGITVLTPADDDVE